MFLAAVADAEPAVVAAALNAFFDVFSEADKNGALTSTGAIAVLKQAHGQLKAALPRFKGQLGRDEYVHLGEAVLNLRRFIVYKTKEGVL